MSVGTKPRMANAAQCWVKGERLYRKSNKASFPSFFTILLQQLPHLPPGWRCVKTAYYVPGTVLALQTQTGTNDGSFPKEAPG